MKSTVHAVCLTLLTSSLAAQTPPVAPPPPAASFAEALAKGKVSLYARLRWEDADQSNLKDSSAFTVSSRFGFTSAPLNGFQGMIEGENVASLGDPDGYNAAGTNPAGAGRTVIGDPTITDVNQAWLSYSGSGASLKIGRQAIALDNQRFVGTAAWRQNMQTFDAATLSCKPAGGLTFSYSYVARVSRVLGNKAPQPDFTGNSHFLNASYGGGAGGTLAVYAYLLDFDNSAPNSSDTFGASYSGNAAVSPDLKANYRVEYATQRDAGKNPVSYTANYFLAELGGATKVLNFGAGYEVMGSDGGKKGFATPLASAHAFAGWADVFTATPARGLRDLYASAGVNLPGGFPAKVVYHDFHSDQGGADYGTEWDAVITHKVAKYWTLMAKAARYEAGGPFFNTNKYWLQAEFVY